MDIQSFTDIIQKADSLTESPENYLSGQEEYTSEIRQLTKILYDFNKYNEPHEQSTLELLDELVLDDLDVEQVWQQIELRNKFICQEFVSDFAQFLVKKNRLPLTTGNADSEELDKESDNDGNKSDFSEVKNGVDFKGGSDEDEEDFDSSESHDGDDDDDNQSLGKDGKDNDFTTKKSSIVDDKFFKLHEMEKFLEKEENDLHNDSEEDDEDLIDYFEDLSESDDEKEGPAYDDFFDQPNDELPKRKRKKIKNSENGNDVPSKKKVKFDIGGIPADEYTDDEFSENDSEEDENGNNSETLNKKNSDSISTFEARQERLKSRIRALEEEALKDKPWQLKGEVAANSRPQNSLLEEFVEFDSAIRPPPVMTEKTTLKLEDIIIQRIKDKAWDDVERKVKPVEDPKEYKKKLVLDQEKSKLSLAQIYEQEYLKKKEARSENFEDKPEEVSNEHLEIDKMMKSLFAKLDALSNFHFTPKMASTEIKIVSNLPAVTVEEVAPVATSDAALLAPEEIKAKMKGDLIGRTERTKTDKKRERRAKKKKQRIKQKRLEQKERVVKEKSLNGKGKKVSKKLLKKLGSNVVQANENGKHAKSSNAFFTKLEDEVQAHIKSKSGDLKKYEKNNKLDVKKLKL